MDSNNWDNFKNKFINTYSYINSENCKGELTKFHSKCEELEKEKENSKRIKLLENINTLTKEINMLNREKQNLTQIWGNLSKRNEVDIKSRNQNEQKIIKNSMLCDFIICMQDKTHGKFLKIKNHKLIFSNTNKKLKSKIKRERINMELFSSVREKIIYLSEFFGKWDNISTDRNLGEELGKDFHRFYVLCEKYFLKVKSIENK